MKTSRSRDRLPDLVIATRVALSFVAVGLSTASWPFALVAVALIVVVIAMDGLDGYLARSLGVESELGAVLDITGDRIVEHVFWIYFAVAGVVPLWVPLVIVTRSFAVDSVRSLALREGRTAFGAKTMMRSAVSRFLVSSRAMRSIYGIAKLLAFVLAGGVIAAGQAGPIGAGFLAWLEPATLVVVIACVAINLLRGAPVLWDSGRFLSHSASSAGGCDASAPQVRSAST